MKKLFKKGLSLFLAVIMLMSVLPMNAMAVMIMDQSGSERVELPVLDKTDRVVDTHARPGSSSTSGDRPEVPTPGGDDDANEFSIGDKGKQEGNGPYLTDSNIAFDLSSDPMIAVQFPANFPGGTPQITVALIPDFRIASGQAVVDESDTTLAGTMTLSDDAADAWFVPGATFAQKGWQEWESIYKGLMFASQTQDTGCAIAAGDEIRVSKDGVLNHYATSDTSIGKNTYGSIANILSAGFALQNNSAIEIDSGAGTSTLDKSAGLPYMIVVYFGDSSYITKKVNLVFGETAELTVSIATTPAMSYRQYTGDITYATVKNTGTKPVENITVTMARSATSNNLAAASGTYPAAVDVDTPDTGTSKYNIYYGIGDGAGGISLTYYFNGTLSPGETFTFPISATGSSGTPLGGGRNVVDSGHTYRLVAVGNEVGSASTQVTSNKADGQFLAKSTEPTPTLKVHLKDTSGNTIYGRSTQEPHDVKSGTTILSWNQANGCYLVENAKLDSVITVDGADTGYRVTSDENNECVVTVILYTLNVVTSPTGGTYTVQEADGSAVTKWHYMPGSTRAAGITVTAGSPPASYPTYGFSDITGADTVDKTNKKATLTMGAADRTVTIVFEDIMVTVKLKVYLNGVPVTNTSTSTSTAKAASELHQGTGTNNKGIGTVVVRSLEQENGAYLEHTPSAYALVDPAGFGAHWKVNLEPDHTWEVLVNGLPAYLDAANTQRMRFNTNTTDRAIQSEVYVSTVTNKTPVNGDSSNYVGLNVTGKSVWNGDGVQHRGNYSSTDETLIVPQHTKLTGTLTQGTYTLTELTFPDSSTALSIGTPADGDTYDIQATAAATEMQATFKQPFSASVTVYRDGGLDGASRITLVWLMYEEDGTEKFIEGTYRQNKHNFANLDPDITYQVVFGELTSDKTARNGAVDITGETITKDDTEGEIITQKVTLAVDSSGANIGTFVGGGYNTAQKDTIVPTGETITLTPDSAPSGSNWSKWTESQTAYGDSTWTSGENTTQAATYTANSTKTAGQAQTLTAHYAAANGSVTVNVNLNGAKDTANRHEVKLSTASGSLTGAVPLTEGSNNSIYTNGSVPQGKYYIFVDGVCVDTTGFTLAAGGSEEKDVNYYTVTIDAGTGVKSGTAAVTGGTANTVNGGYLSGTTGIVLEAEPATNYDVNAATWADQVASPGSVSGTGSTSGGKAIYTLDAITKETEYEVSFAKLKSQSTITVKKNDGTSANYTGFNGSVVLSTSATDATAGAITLTQDATDKYKFTTAAGALTVGDTYYVWATNTDNSLGQMYTGITFTASATATDNNKDVTYYKLTVKADTNGAGAGAKVGLGAANTVTTTASSVENYYLSGSKPYIIADASAGLYDFDKWSASNVTVPTVGSRAVQQVTTTESVATATAGYSKVRFDATFTLSLDGVKPTIGSGNPITAVKLVDKDGNTVSSGVTSASGTNAIVYTASQIPSSAADYKWVVTTVSGDYEQTGVSGSDNTNSSMALYSVHVTASGTGWSGATVKTSTQTATAGTTAVGKSDTSFTLALTPASGFTQKSGTNAWTEDVTGHGTVAPTSYTSLKTTDWPSTGVTLTPNFTYSVTLVPTRDDSATPVVAMTSGVTSVSAGSTAAIENGTTHKWTVTGLEPGTTGTSYTVSVNGFASSITIDTDDAGTEVPVQMYEIKTVKDPITANGTAYVNLGASASGTATAVYVPKGASTTASGDTQVSVKATAGTTYRLRTAAKDGSGNTTWTGLGTAADTDNATTKVTFSSIAADITATAHFVEQFTVNLQQSNGGSSTIKGETVNTPTGSTWNPTTAAASATGTIDKDNIIKITAAAATGYQLKGWKITAGDLYGSESSGTLSGQINVSGNQDSTDTDLYLSTDTEVFVKVSANTTVTAVYEAGTYEVVITVKKDNAAYTGLTVELKNQKSGDTSYTGANALTDNGDGTYTVRALAGTYDIYVNGTNVSAATTDTEKDIKVETTGAPFTKEVNYYTVDLVTVPASIDAADEVYVDHNATVRSSGRQTSIIMLAKSAPYTTNVAATDNNYSVSAAKTHYRFDNWSVTAPASNGGSMGDTSDPTTTYQLPAEGTLTANTGIDKDNHITLTATFQAQWKVTVSNDDGTNGGTITKPANSTVYNVVGTWNTASGGVVYVDKGSSLPLVTTPKTTMRVQGWKEESTSGKVAFVKTSGGAAITADANGFNVDTAARNNITATPSGDVEVKVYWERDAFTGTINLVRADGTTGYTEDNTKVYIELKDAASTGADATTHTNHGSGTKHVTQTMSGSTPTNAWTDTMLLNNHTYQVWVNGYNTGKTLTTASATTTVKMFELTLDVKIDGQGDTVGDGSGTDYKPTDTKTQSTFKAGYAPNNTAGTSAFFVPEASGDVVINLAALAAGSGLRYSKTADGTTFWTAGKGTLANADNANTTLTLDTDATGMADVTIYANYISVLTLTVQTATPASGNVAGGSVKITAGGDANGTKNPISIDKNNVATVVATPTTSTAMNSYAFVDWIIATTTPAGSGKWATSASDATEDTGDRTATDFFAPSANTTLEASFKNLKATGTTITGDTTTYPTANYNWDNTKGLTMTVKAGYTAGLTAPVDLSNLATAATKKLTPSIAAKSSLSTGQTDGSVNSIITITTAGATINGGSGLAVGSANATTTEVTFKTGLAIGVYVADLVVTDGDVTVTVPVTVNVVAPEEFAVSIKTFPDGATNPSGANIQSVILVPTAGNTALTSGNITLTETSAGSGVWTGNAKWDGTYTVYVDGYATSTTDVKNTPVANGTASVVEKEVKDLYTVSFAKAEYKDGSNVMGEPKFVTVPDSGVTTVYTVVPTNDTTSGAVHAIVVPAGKTVRVSDNANANASGSYHYRKDGWNHYKVNTSSTASSAGIPASNIYTVDATKPSTTTNAPIFLDPQYVQQFKLTLGSPKDAAATPAKLGSNNHVTAKLGGGNTKQSEQANNDYVMVDANVAVTITELALFPTGDRTKYIFKDWIQDQTGTTAGTFGTDASSNVTFVPKADTTISPTYWERPTLRDKDSYHLNIGKGLSVTTTQWGTAEPKKSTNDEPYYDWTQKDATLDSTDEFQIWTDANGDGVEDAGEWITLTGAQVVKTTPSAGVVRYTIQDSYLKTLTLPDGETNVTYKVRVKSAIDTNDTTLKADLNLAVNPDPLTEVKIQVKDTTSDTASVDDPNRDLVKYLSHLKAGIVKDNVLTWTWYYGDTAPSGAWHDGGFKKSDRDGYLANAEAAVTAAGGTKLSSLGISDVEDINSPTGDTAPVTKDALKGKYIYAVVSASNTGYGTVITNGIAVDYDATVTVQKDGSSVSAATGYTVYLLEKNASNADGYATMPGTAKTTTWNATNKNFETTNSALTGGKTYDVYVNKVEGSTAYYVKTGKTVSPTSQSATVDFYSVNAVDTTVKDAYDNSATPKNVGETFNDGDAPTTVFSTTGASSASITVPGGNGVFKGSAVTAKTSQGTFDQDYHVDWGVTTTEPTSSAPLGYTTTTDQTKAYAASNGITVTSSIAAKTWAGVQLDQNLYTVTGNIWANTNDAGIVNTSAKLTSGEYVFTGTSLNGTKGQDVTFTAKVPKSGATNGKITGKYTITADPKTSPRSTILGYVEWQPTTANQAAITTALTSNRLDGSDKNTLKAHITADNTQAFTIVVEASTYILTIPAVTGGHGKATQNWSTQSSAPPIPTSGNNFTSDAWVEDYAYASGKTYTFELVNEGNTSLDVTLNVKRSNSADDGYVYGDKASGSSKATNVLIASSGNMVDGVGVTFAGLATKFASLAPEAKETFTVTIPAGLAVDDTADYAFEFTSTEAGKTDVYGPCVVYKLTQEINPLKITGISATAVSGGYNATGLVVQDSANSAVTLTAAQQAAEVEYKWYVTDIGVTPTLTKTGVGSLSNNATLAAGNQADGTYKTAAGDQGKSLWVVAHNKGTGNVIEAAVAKVTDLPFDLDIIVKENDDKVAAAKKDNYKVYLVPDTLSNPDFDSDLAAQEIVEAKDKTGTDGAYTAVGLDSNTTYKIYTNAVGGTTNANWQDSTKTAALANFTGNKSPEVIYHDVILNNTTVTNGIYDSTITANGTKFLKAYATEETTRANSPLPSGESLVVPTAKFGTTDVATDDLNKWVQEGQTVNLSYANWNRDYKLEWTGVTTGAAVNTAPSSGTVGGTGTLKVMAAEATVKTKLTLNLYSVTVYVVGDNGGSVSEIKLTNKGTGGEAFNFTTLTGYTDTGSSTVYVTGMATAQNSGVGVGSTAVFRVPGGDYTVSAEKAAGSNLDGYLHPHTTPIPDMSTHKNPVDVSVSATATTDTADVVVVVAGQAMQVTDDAVAKVGDQEHNDVAGSGNNAAAYDGTAVSNGTYTRTITLPYGYAADSFDITVTNTSAAAGNVIHNVTMDKTSTQLGPNNEIAIADAGDAVSIALDGTQDLDKGDATKVGVAIAAGLPVNTYTSKLTFTFETEGTGKDGNQTATVTYNLVIEVVPARFSAVSAKDSNGAAITGMVPYGVGLVADTYTTVDHDLFGIAPGATNAIVEKTTGDGDYTYQWYYSDPDKTATESWKDGVVNVADGAKVTDDGTSSGTPVTGKTLSADIIKLYQGKKLYLVITAEDGKNVTEAAISDPYTTGFQPVVKISVDGANVTAQPNDGDYVVTITDDSDATKTWKTVWDDTAKGFVPVADDGNTKVFLDASKSYVVKTNKYKGDNDTTLVAHGTKLSNASANARTVTVPYFTVNAVETKDFEAITGLGETFTSMPEVEFALGGKDIADATPVLSGQKVTAKIKTAWSEDYKLTWHKAVGDATTPDPNPDPDDNAYEATSTGAKTMTALGTKQTATEATAANASGEVTVSGKTYIGGRLDQNYYTITGTVVGSNASASIIGVTVEKTDEPKKTYTWNKNDGQTELIKPTDGNSNGILNPGDTIDFKVVKGTYTITSTADSSNTVISKVVWEPGVTGVEDTVTGPSGVLSSKGVAASETKLKYNFEVHVDASELSLSVTDKTTADGDSDNDVTVTAGYNAPAKGTKSVEHYFSYIDKKLADASANDVITFPLKLENGGNVDMKVGLEVFHFASASAVPVHTDQTKWEGATQVQAPEFTAGSSVTASVVVPATSASGKTVMTLTDVMAKDTVVLANASVGGTPDAVDALTITLGKDAWSKDSGVFVFRFTGESDAGDVYMYYVLDLTIDQLPIQAVTTQLKDATGAALASTAMPGVGDKLQVEGYVDGTTAGEGLDHVTVKTSNKPDTAMANAAKLTDNDVHFAWVSVPGGTANNDNGAAILSQFTVNATTGVLGTSTTDYKVNALDKEYVLTAADMGRDFYLIAYAPNTTSTKTNATDKAISDVVQAQRTVGVQIGLNGNTTSHIQPGSGTNDPQYTVYLQEAGKPLFESDGTTLADGVLTTTWSSDGNKQYTAPIDLGKTYHVWAASYKGGADFVDTGLVLGKNGSDTTYKQIVVYYNVTHTPDVAVDNGTLDNFAAYLPGGVAGTANALQKALKVEVSNSATLANVTSWATLPDPTGTNTSATVPVLTGMHLKVTVDATAASGNTTATNKTWGDAEPYHTMATTGWANGTTATSQSGIGYPADDGSGNRLVQSGDIVADATKTFSAKLNQVLFTLKFVVRDNSDASQKGESTITAAALQADTGKGETGNVPSGGFTATVGNGTNTKQGSDGAVVTFTNVPAGNYIIGADRGSMTKIDGYTWEDDTTVSLTGDVVAVTNTSDNANDNAKNTIQIQYSTFSVQWQDNFITNSANGTVGDAHATDFYNSTGFKKVDTASTGPFLALTEGYSATSDTLTYKVRLVNDGVMSLSGVYIEQTDGTSDLVVDWTNVRYGKADDTVTTLTVDEDHPIGTLEPSEYLEFDVTIPANQSARSANYSDVFEMIFNRSGESSNFNPNQYTPAYQVKPVVEFAQGNSLVLYGGDHFESGTVNISKSWTTGAYNPSFVYTPASAAEVAQYLADNPTATLPGNFYTSDGADVGSDATGTLPGWVSVTSGTGVVTFDSSEGKRATEVNVQVKNDPKNFDDYNDSTKDCKVDNEIVFLIKAVDQDTNKAYFTTYTINVEPGQLSLPDNTYWWDKDSDAELDERSGEPVSFRHFSYTNVVNQITEDVVKSTDIAGSDANAVPNNTGLGNTDAKNKTVNVDSVHTGTWKVDKATYVLGDDIDYTFTIDYKPQDSAEKWNYKPGVATVKITAIEPDRSLKFADEIFDATDVMTVADTDYSDQDAEDTTMTGKDNLVPKKLALTDNTYRENEHIVYLDKKPYYDVRLEKVGGVYDVKLTVETSKGVSVFAVDDEGKETALDLTGLTFANDTETSTKSFRLKISDLGNNLWAGEHQFTVKAKGYSDPDHAADAEYDVEATYELILVIEKKVIPQAHISDLTEPEKFDKPDKDITVEGENPSGDPDEPVVELDTWVDEYGNTPISKVEVKYDPDDDPFKPSTEYETTVTLEADQNYTFDDETPEDEEPNYTAGDTPEEGEDYPDDGYTVELTPDDPDKPEAGKNTKVTFTKKKTTADAILNLKFNDTDAKNPEDGLDTHEWSEEYENDRVWVYYLDQIPDYFDVYLRNDGTEDLYNVALNVTTNSGVRVDGKTGNDQMGILNATGGMCIATPDTTTPFTTLPSLKVSDDGVNNRTLAFQADLRPLKTDAEGNVTAAYAGTYTLEVHATGTANASGQATARAAGDIVEADYTLIIKIVPRPIVLANVTGLGAAEVDQKVSDNVAKIDVTGQVLYRGEDSIDASNPNNVSDKTDVDLLNKHNEENEKGPEAGLDVNGLQRLSYRLTWVELDENGNEKGTLSDDPETGDTFKPNTAYRVKLKLIPDPNYIFVRFITEDNQTEDYFYFDPKDNGKETGVEDNPRIDEEQVEYTLTTVTGVEVKLHPEEDDTEPNKPIVIEKEQSGKIAQLKFDDVKVGASTDTTGPAVHDVRTITVTKGGKLGVYTINLGAYANDVYQVREADQEDPEDPKLKLDVSGVLSQPQATTDPDTGETTYAVKWTLKRLNEHDTELKVDDNGNPTNMNSWELDLSALSTATTGNGVFKLVITADGFQYMDETHLESKQVQEASYTIIVNITNPGGGGGGSVDPVCPAQVTYLLGVYGTTDDPVMEMIANGKGYPKAVPTVTAITGYKFLGWSLTGPTGDVQEDAKRKLEDPKTVNVTGDTTFYAVYQPVYELGRPFHEHYVIGYPNGKFGPADNINRASVATIIARAVLPNFVEGADYGNPGGYSDVTGHWAESAIAYCSKYGVFKGYDDGTFKPDQFITRQELALVIARISGVKSAKELPFADMADAGSWAVDGIYTAYANGWVNGYPDGTFQPQNPIRRDETVKIFNAYLYRGVNEEGLSKLTEYVHSGVASNVTENGTTEYMTWPDVPRDQWAYYEIIEAANDHEYAVDETLPKGYTLPETWDKCWIDEKWRYHDDLNDGGPTVGLLSAGFRAWNR